MADSTSYFEEFELKDGTSVAVQGRKGSDRVSISFDNNLITATYWIDLAGANELRDALTAITYKVNQSVAARG